MLGDVVAERLKLRHQCWEFLHDSPCILVEGVGEVLRALHSVLDIIILGLERSDRNVVDLEDNLFKGIGSRGKLLDLVQRPGINTLFQSG